MSCGTFEARSVHGGAGLVRAGSQRCSESRGDHVQISLVDHGVWPGSRNGLFVRGRSGERQGSQQTGRGCCSRTRATKAGRAGSTEASRACSTEAGRSRARSTEAGCAGRADPGRTCDTETGRAESCCPLSAETGSDTTSARPQAGRSIDSAFGRKIDGDSAPTIPTEQGGEHRTGWQASRRTGHPRRRGSRYQSQSAGGRWSSAGWQQSCNGQAGRIDNPRRTED